MTIASQPLDLLKKTKDLKDFRRTFILSPVQWRNHQVSINIQWKSIPFSKENSPSIPRVRGLYCFVIRHENSIFPDHGYICYIGKTGDSNNRTLFDRYKDYLIEKERVKRIKIFELLNYWEKDLYFYYWEVQDDNTDIGQIESELLNSLTPPLNERDFIGDFGKVMKEAWKN